MPTPEDQPTDSQAHDDSETPASPAQQPAPENPAAYLNAANLESTTPGSAPQAAELSANAPAGPAAWPLGYPVSLPAAKSVPEDLKTPLGILDLLIVGAFYFVGGAAIALILFAIAVRLFGVSREAFVDSSAAKAPLIILSQVLLSAATLVLLFVMVRSRGTADFWPSVGWRRLPGPGTRAASILKYLCLGVALAAVVGFISSFVDRNMVLPMEELLRDRQSVLLLMALGVLVAPLFEETIFRGCIYPVVARSWGMPIGVVVTGVLFGAAHAPQLWPGYAQIGLLMFVGIVLTYIRARTGTVAAGYFVHLGYNSIFFAGFYFATGGLRHFPG